MQTTEGSPHHQLTINGLHLERGDRLLFKNLSFTLNSREALFLEGRNGSGKTSLLRTLCGLLLPNDGDILWNGEPIRELAEDYTRHLLYLGHKPGIKEELSGVENLRITSTLDGNPISEEIAWDALKRIGLKGFEDLPTKTLSQGQKRRVALARLLVSQASLWILDEPFVALDVVAVAELQEVMQQHLDKGGMLILTTHQEVDFTSGEIRHLKLGTGGSH